MQNAIGKTHKLCMEAAGPSAFSDSACGSWIAPGADTYDGGNHVESKKVSISGNDSAFAHPHRWGG
jgi:hypothetical protein